MIYQKVSLNPKIYLLHQTKKNIFVLIDSGSTFSFVYLRVLEENNCYVYVVHNFQIKILSGVIMKSGGIWDNVKLQIYKKEESPTTNFY